MGVFICGDGSGGEESCSFPRQPLDPRIDRLLIGA
jgi:hypothetical protein